MSNNNYHSGVDYYLGLDELENINYRLSKYRGLNQLVNLHQGYLYITNWQKQQIDINLDSELWKPPTLPEGYINLAGDVIIYQEVLWNEYTLVEERESTKLEDSWEHNSENCASKFDIVIDYHLERQRIVSSKHIWRQVPTLRTETRQDLFLGFCLLLYWCYLIYCGREL